MQKHKTKPTRNLAESRFLCSAGTKQEPVLVETDGSGEESFLKIPDLNDVPQIWD